jgi:hypothetical protein
LLSGIEEGLLLGISVRAQEASNKLKNNEAKLFLIMAYS